MADKMFKVKINPDLVVFFPNLFNDRSVIASFGGSSTVGLRSKLNKFEHGWGQD